MPPDEIQGYAILFGLVLVMSRVLFGWPFDDGE